MTGGLSGTRTAGTATTRTATSAGAHVTAGDAQPQAGSATHRHQPHVSETTGTTP